MRPEHRERFENIYKALQLPNLSCRRGVELVLQGFALINTYKDEIRKDPKLKKRAEYILGEGCLE